VLEHRFEVWVRPGKAISAKHPHLGTWARCARCGLERDWLWAAERIPKIDEIVIDQVHGVARPLGDVLAIARGVAIPEPEAAKAAPREKPVTHRSAQPIRRDRAGRGSTRAGRTSRPLAQRDAPRDPAAD
jgi:hypothetical protein